MQLCTIYCSANKADTYLYVEKKDDFSRVPDELRKLLGRLELVMTLDLDGRAKLALADLCKVKAELVDKGFYLQLPPPEQNLLDEHRKLNGFEASN